ncbi:MAG: methyltransferase domain-containing protein [Candidatus Thorarchaeota archaeon]|nr:methyltransferase domain-containing protein [Candidatus Thorarchaeota archaeon]
MVRLDVWLVETRHFTSRQAAKRAIKDGYVIVNGDCSKPSYKITGKESIQILDNYPNMPMGFHKLKAIDDSMEEDLVTPPCLALDIGSSVGGFLSYLSQKGARVIGVEISNRFEKELKNLVESNSLVSVVYADAFEIEPTSLVDKDSLDILLIDVTTDPSGTLHLISKFSPFLKKNGTLVSAFKIENKSEIVLQLLTNVENLGYSDIRSLHLEDTRQEVHIIARRM